MPKPLQTMDELLAHLPDTGFTHGKESNEAAEFVATHPETWQPVIIPDPK